jgi:Tfp pilus assembly protein PilF
VIRILIFVLVAVVTGYAQMLLEPVTLSPDKEAWLAGDIDRTLESVLKINDAEETASVKQYNLGYLYFLKEDYTTSLSHFQKSLASPDPSPYAYLYMARIYERSGFLSAAYQQIRNALDLEANNYDLLMEQARMSELTDRLSDAEIIYRNIIEQYDDRIPPRIALGNLYIKRKNYDQAKIVLEPEETIYPESCVLIARADLYYNMGKDQEAADFIQQMCRAYPNAPEIQSYIDTLKIKYDINNPDIVDPGNNFKFKFLQDEEINYKVKYGFITLGWINVRVGKPVSMDGKMAYPVRFYLNSNPDFSMMITLQQLYESYIDAETFNAIRTRIYTPGDEKYLAKTYYFQYDKNLLEAQIIRADGRFEYVKKLLPSRAQDGVSMLYYARGVVSSKTSGRTTVVIDEEYKYGYITYLDEKEEVEIEEEDVDAVKIFARSDFKGVAGMNGDAWGWFSEGPEFVPLQGKISIILGSITVIMDNDTPMNESN